MWSTFFHLVALLLYALDYYYLHLYITNYNDGLVPDQQMFIIRGNSVMSGNLPYENLQIYESLAPPLSMYVLAVPIIFNKIIPIPLHIMYRIYFSFFNLISLWLLLKIGEKKLDSKRSTLPALLFGLNPYIISQAAISGSDECMGAFLMVLVAYSIINRHDKTTIFLIGLGTSIKYYPILLTPYFLSTKKSISSKLLCGILTTLSVILFVFPFYFVDHSNFMAQFNNRVNDLPWNSYGNSGLIILIARLDLFNFAQYSDLYRMSWMLFLLILGLWVSFKGSDDLQYISVIPSIFFIVYPKFFFSYFLIVFPLIILSIVNFTDSLYIYLILNLGLIFGGLVNDRVFGFGSIYRQEPGHVPIMMIIGILAFYVVWIFTTIASIIGYDETIQKPPPITIQAPNHPTTGK